MRSHSSDSTQKPTNEPPLESTSSNGVEAAKTGKPITTSPNGQIMNGQIVHLNELALAHAYGNGGDDGKIITDAARFLMEKGGGTININGSPVLDTPIEIYQGVSLNFSGTGSSILKIRNAPVALRIFGRGISDQGVGGFVQNFSVEGPPTATGIQRIGTRTHVLRQYCVSDLAVGEVITSRDLEDNGTGRNHFGGAFNASENAVFRRCKLGQHIFKGEAYNNRNRIQALYQSCETGLLVEGSDTNEIWADCQNCRTGVELKEFEGKKANLNIIHFRNENGKKEIQCNIYKRTKGTQLFGVYNKKKVKDAGRRTKYY